MHPILSNRRSLLLYLTGWVMVGLLLSAVLGLAVPRAYSVILAFAGPLVLVYSSMCLSSWYVCRAMPLERHDLPPLLVSLLTAAALTSAVWVALGGLWALALGRLGLPDGSFGPRELTVLFFAGVPLYLLSAVVHYLLIAVESARAAERRALESAVAAREAELRALRAQLHPHFLFNSLNSINALVGSDPEGARRMTQSLGDFLRGTLQLTNRERVPLAEEFALVDRYLSIERVRFGARLGVERAIEPGAERCLVPPLLLQPLVENAIKHGVSERLEGGVISIDARRRGDAVVLTIENPIDEPASAHAGEGHGLENVKRRLAALDPRRTHLDVRRESGRFRVILTLPAETAEDEAPAPAVAPAAIAASAAAAPPPREGIRPGEARLA